MNALPVVIYLMTYGREYATPENQWSSKILEHFPRWLVINNDKLIKDWYDGHGNFYTAQTFLTWAKPCGFWLLFVTLGNMLVVVLAGFKDIPRAQFFWLCAGLCLAAGVVFMLRAMVYTPKDYTQE